MNDFIRDNSWQRKIRNKVLKPYYKKISHEGRFIFCDKGELSTLLQKELAIDTIIQLNNNEVVSIEEKIVRWPGYVYEAYTLETWSCTIPGMERQGWMYYAKCDYLFYCFVQPDESLYIHVIPFQKLKNWFFSNNQYKNYRISRTRQINKTETRVVPIVDVWNSIPYCQHEYIDITKLPSLVT
jgi:hypothetical protein